MFKLKKDETLVIRVRGMIDQKRMKELVKIYKEVLGEQPFIIIDDEVREIEPFYDYRESSQEEPKDERFISVFEKVQIAIDQYMKQGLTYQESLNKAREENGMPKLELPDVEVIPLYSHEGKVADVTVMNGETINIEPGTFENLHITKDSGLKFDELMNAGKNVTPGDEE